MTAGTIADVRKGDVVHFRTHSLRVETDPLRKVQRVRLQGRESRNGCPYVTRWYFANVPCVIERAEGAKCIECNGKGTIYREGGDWGATPAKDVPCWSCRPEGAK
jgi:hypothetical protein